MADISKILKEARLNKNLTIEELSDKTKIRKIIIENLETGNFGDFQEVYLRAFIRTIAKELKISEDEKFLEAYKSIPKPEYQTKVSIPESEEDLSKKPSAPKRKLIKIPAEDEDEIIPEKTEKKRKVIKIEDEEHKVIVPSVYSESISYNTKNNLSKLFKSKPKLNSNIIIYSAIILFLLVILLITFWPVSNTPEIESSKLDSAGKSKPINISGKKEDKGILNFFQQSDSLTLRAEVSDTVWFSMIIDKVKKVQTTLVPQQTYQWTAAEQFVVTHGNAGRIKLYLNDQLLQPFVPPGYVAKDVVIKANEIYNPNSIRIDSIRTQKKAKLKKQQEPEFRFIEPSNPDDFEKKVKK